MGPEKRSHLFVFFKLPTYFLELGFVPLIKFLVQKIFVTPSGFRWPCQISGPFPHPLAFVVFHSFIVYLNAILLKLIVSFAVEGNPIVPFFIFPKVFPWRINKVTPWLGVPWRRQSDDLKKFFVKHSYINTSRAKRMLHRNNNNQNWMLVAFISMTKTMKSLFFRRKKIKLKIS